MVHPRPALAGLTHGDPALAYKTDGAGLLSGFTQRDDGCTIRAEKLNNGRISLYGLTWVPRADQHHRRQRSLRQRLRPCRLSKLGLKVWRVVRHGSLPL